MSSEVNLSIIKEKYDLDNEARKTISLLKEHAKKFEEFPFLEEYLNHHLNLNGKKKRLTKMIAVARICGGVDENVRHIINALEFINSTIFLDDDIIDHDDYRKEKPTLNKLIGYEKTLLIGNMLFALAMNELSKIKCYEKTKDEILHDFSYSIFIENVGQYSDLEYKNNFNYKGLGDWEEMVIRHSTSYVISALIAIAKIKNRLDLISVIKDYETNCTLAGAAGDAVKGFLGKEKPKSDINNMNFTILVSYITRDKKFNSPEELEQNIISSNSLEKVKAYIDEKTKKSTDSLKSLQDSFDKEVLNYLSRQNKQIKWAV